MTRISAAKARHDFADIVSRAAFGKERFLLTRHGRKLAAVVPVDDLELLEKIEDRLDLDDAKKALADVKKKGAVRWEKLKADLGL